MVQIRQRFGRLVAVQPLEERNKQGFVAWQCICDCGNFKKTWSVYLTTGITKSCGCLRRDTGRWAGMKSKLRPYEYLYNRFLSYAKRAHKKCTLTYEQFHQFTFQTRCHYCDNPIQWSEYSDRKTDRFNLDRKDNRIDYEETNIVVCCWPCNSGKGDKFSYEEWVVMTRALREYRGI
jgi:hypothetical protein